MEDDVRWRKYFAHSGADIWTVIDRALRVAASDFPAQLRLRRDGIAEKLFTFGRQSHVREATPPHVSRGGAERAATERGATEQATGVAERAAERHHATTASHARDEGAPREEAANDGLNPTVRNALGNDERRNEGGDGGDVRERRRDGYGDGDGYEDEKRREVERREREDGDRRERDRPEGRGNDEKSSRPSGDGRPSADERPSGDGRPSSNGRPGRGGERGNGRERLKGGEGRGVDRGVGRDAEGGTWDEEEEEEDVTAAVLEEQLQEEDRLVERIEEIKDLLRPSRLDNDYLVRHLESLLHMPMTLEALRVTEIGKRVNSFRNHPSEKVRAITRQLIGAWKDLVKECRKSAAAVARSTAGLPEDVSSGLPSPPLDESALLQGRSIAMGASELFRDFGLGLDSGSSRSDGSPDDHRAPPPHDDVVSSLTPPPNMRSEFAAGGGGSEKERLEMAKRKLHERYQGIQDAKKQRTIQVVDPGAVKGGKAKPRFAFSHNARGGAAGGGGGRFGRR
ncbi:unnamed protein product [Closterium sp. Yama58-4]|nr:unnamed protein product [Closterium sp. Yama58-4]